MTHTRRTVSAFILTPLLLVSVASCASDSATAEAPTAAADVAAPEAPAKMANDVPFAEGSDEWVAWSALMGPDGEYAAAASYQAVLERYGDVEPYASILQAELRHIDALVRQLQQMGVEVPDNPYLGTIAAPDDLTSAAEAWAEGEVLNVAMYDELLAYTDNPQLIRVLGNLRRASLESHLPAFEAAAANGGVSPSS